MVLGTGKDTPTSSSKKSTSEKKEEKPKEPEKKEKDKKMTSSFPPSNTTDAVRLKCRELLCAAIKADNCELAPLPVILTNLQNR